MPETQEYDSHHEICRTSLFQQTIDEYSACEVDQWFVRPASRTSLLLSFNGEAVGIATLDSFGEGSAAIRGVAIKDERQGEGHGRVLLQMVEEFAEALGISRLCVNADQLKTAFYEKSGFIKEVWGSAELDDFRAGGAAALPVQMVKPIGPLHSRCL